MDQILTLSVLEAVRRKILRNLNLATFFDLDLQW